MYALVAAGYALAFAVTETFNFSLWVVFAVGALAMVLLANAGYPFWLAAADGIAAGGLAGVILDRVAMLPRRLRGRGSIESMVATIAAAALCGTLLVDRFGTARIAFSGPAGHAPAVHLGAATVALPQLIALGICALTLFALQGIVRATRFGVAMRAVAGNPSAAGAAGVNLELLIAQSAFLGAALVAAAGVASAVVHGGTDAMAGFRIALPVFAAVLLGGLTSLPGVIAAGYLVAAAQLAVASVLPVGASGDVVALAIMAAAAAGLRAGIWQKRALRTSQE